MTKFLTLSLTALTLSLTPQAFAEDITEDFVVGSDFTQMQPQTLDTVEVEVLPGPLPRFASDTTIAVARLDGGRLIPTPYGEVEDWEFLDRRIGAKIVQLGASAHIAYIPELPLSTSQSSNNIDEVRVTAANEGFEYVLIYGVGTDATWSSFGGKALVETGLTVAPDCAAWEEAKAKALLVHSRTGYVLGAVTADDIEFNIGQLADRAEKLITHLSRNPSVAGLETEGGTDNI